MKSVCRLIAILLLLLPFCAEAEVKLWLWKPQNALLPFILPAENGDNAETAARKYVRAIRQEPELRLLLEPILDSFINGHPMGWIKREEFGFIVANMPDDYGNSLKYKRIAGLKEAYSARGLTNYLYPVAGAIHLSQSSVRDVYTFLRRRATLVTFLGGPDVTPAFYTNRRNNPHSRNYNVTRDKWEFDLIKGLFEYIELQGLSSPTLMAICRSMQEFAAYFGHQLTPDIPLLQNIDAVEHMNSKHLVELIETPWNHLRKAFPGKEHIEVNSLHHQSSWPRRNSPLHIAAIAPDGIVEAFEFLQGLLTQFHPELMKELYPILYHMVDYARERQKQRLACEDLL